MLSRYFPWNGLICNFVISFFFNWGQFWLLSLPASVCVCLCLSVCVSTTRQLFKLGFGPKIQNTLVKVPVVLCTDRPWPLRSNLTWKSKFTPSWACPHHNSSPIQARITKFGPKVRNTLFKIPIVFFFVCFFFFFFWGGGGGHSSLPSRCVCGGGGNCSWPSK